MQPTVSVVIPVYNAASYVGRAVQSVLTQRDFDSVEVILVDDGSTDDSAKVIDQLAREDSRVVTLHSENRGPSAARNLGIAQATGRYLAFLDADDWFLPHKLALQTSILEARPALGLVTGDHRIVNELSGFTLDVVRGVPHVPYPVALAYRNWFAPMAPLVRMSVAEEVGGFDESLRASEDWDYWYRCAQMAEIHYEPGVVGVYRLHGDQSHRNRPKMITSHLRFIEKHLSDKPALRRGALAYFHLGEAKLAKGRNDWVAMYVHLARTCYYAGSLSRLAFVWNLPR